MGSIEVQCDCGARVRIKAKIREAITPFCPRCKRDLTNKCPTAAHGADRVRQGSPLKERLWCTESELKAVIRSLDRIAVVGACEFARLAAANPDVDQSELLIRAQVLADWVGGGRDVTSVQARWPKERLDQLVVAGYALLQWLQEAKRGKVNDAEIARLLEDQSAVERARREILGGVRNS